MEEVTITEQHPRWTDVPNWAYLVLEYCDWTSRVQFLSVSKGWYDKAKSDPFYLFLLHILESQHDLYIPPKRPTNVTWKVLFHDLYRLRNMWNRPSSEAHALSINAQANMNANNSPGERLKINVYARFKPLQKKLNDLGNEDEENDENGGVTVNMPLHHRLAIIKMANGIKSNREALKLLTASGGWFQKKWQTLASTEENNNNSSTNKRYDFHTTQSIKPKFTVKEKAPRMVARVQTIEPEAGRVVMLAPSVGLREFAFNCVLPDTASQSALYESSTRRLVTDFINGFNATAIVYGQTGAGKTYSMFGHDDVSVLNTENESRGIIPRAVEELFEATEKRRVENGIESTVFVSYVEVFGDQVSDLLRNGERVGHSKAAAHGFVLSGAAEKRADTIAEVETLFMLGEQQKRRAATAMNERSTRAHSVFIISLEQKRATTTTNAAAAAAAGNPSIIEGASAAEAVETATAAASTAAAASAAASTITDDVTVRSRLFLADLGGSEQVKKSQVEAGGMRAGAEGAEFTVGFQMGENMRETVYINLGLLALKQCIEALNNNDLYVPYQNSKLTMLLSQGLGGNSKTSVIICNSQDPVHASETLATLRFGEKCAKVESEARNNASMLASVLAQLDKDIAELDAAIVQKERWESREEVRTDELAEAGTFEAAIGGKEIKKVFMLVGAENERRALERLLLRREQLTGSRRAKETRNGMVLATVDEYGDEAATDRPQKKKGGDAAPTKTKVSTGFGKQFAEMYGLGSAFDEQAEFNTENSRFNAGISKDELAALPAAVRKNYLMRHTQEHKKAAVAWVFGEEEEGGEDAKKKQPKKKKQPTLKSQWATGEGLDEAPEVLEKRAVKAKRNSMPFAGFSA